MQIAEKCQSAVWRSVAQIVVSRAPTNVSMHFHVIQTDSDHGYKQYAE